MVEVEVFKLSQTQPNYYQLPWNQIFDQLNAIFKKSYYKYRVLQKCEKQRLMLGLGLVWKFK